MLENAVRICDATFGNIYRWDGENLHLVAANNTPGSFVQTRARIGLHPGANDPVGRTIVTKAVVHIADLAAERDYIERRNPGIIAAVEVGGVRTLLAVPMLKDDQLIGAFHLSRQEVRPFTDKQIALVTNFAAQAVIAIENTRLLNELRQRTTTDQRTATSPSRWSSRPPPLTCSRSLAARRSISKPCSKRWSKVRRGCAGPSRANIFRFDGELLRIAATYNVPQQVREWLEQNPIRPGRQTGTARAALERRTIHIPDVLADPDYSYGAKAVEPYRTILGVPILKGDDLLGVLLIYLLEVRPFTDKQIALVETFADQAAIAIENVRLFEAEQQRTRELTESLEQQTATSEVLQVISSSPGDLQPVFATMLEKAVRICDAKFGNIYRWDGETLHALAAHNTPSLLPSERSVQRIARIRRVRWVA